MHSHGELGFHGSPNFSDVYRLVHFLPRFRAEEYLSTEAIEVIEERNQKRFYRGSMNNHRCSMQVTAFGRVSE